MQAEATPAKPQPRVKSKTPSRAKPSKTLLQFSKKKRKRENSEGSDIDMDATPPPSPTEEESGIEKRRSGRNASSKRKKYVDDVQMTFSDEDGIKGLPKDVSGVASQAMLDDLLGPIKEPAPGDGEKGGPQPTESEVVPSSTQAGPNYAFIDPTAEDTMIVQYILTSRMGTRELEDSEVILIISIYYSFNEVGLPSKCCPEIKRDLEFINFFQSRKMANLISSPTKTIHSAGCTTFTNYALKSWGKKAFWSEGFQWLQLLQASSYFLLTFKNKEKTI